ncbi:hypothetical protein FRB93_011652 [Tulasnella sp. JGI-2019a]|nr:hypothetical protein FRB93_011652 [Tulasnella sp. JGI-2019a]
MSLSPRQTCEGAGLSCATSQILVAITWVSTLLLLCQFLLVMISSLYYCRHQATVWSEPVNQLEWFRGGATNRSTVLGSGPPTPTFPSNPVPHLERMAVGWQSQATRAAAQPMEYARSDPQPLTLVFAPELPPSRAPIHYRASANVSVGALPTRKSSKRKPPPALPTATSLYPTSVQLVMDTPPERQQSPPPATRSPPVIPGSQTQNIAVLAAEPLPVQDWPRVNPQEPYRPKKSMTTYVPTVASTAAPMTIAPRSSVDSVTRTTPRGPRRRPSPLDLTAALPGAKRSK